MKIQKETVFYTCTTEELEVDGTPPQLDENGTAPIENSICELLNDDGTITQYFQRAGATWYQYGEKEVV